jgi:hypothetical protein
MGLLNSRSQAVPEHYTETYFWLSSAASKKKGPVRETVIEAGENAAANPPQEGPSQGQAQPDAGRSLFTSPEL